MTTDLSAKLDAIDARYSRALDAKPGKGPIVKVEALWDSACDVPDLLRALRAVLDLHREFTCSRGAGQGFCAECDHPVPCPTRLAITTHIEGAS